MRIRNFLMERRRGENVLVYLCTYVHSVTSNGKQAREAEDQLFFSKIGTRKFKIEQQK